MSSDPINIADDDAPDLELVWYRGSVGPRLAVTRESMSVDMSLTELSRLVHTAGVLPYVPTPYGKPPEETPAPCPLIGRCLKPCPSAGACEAVSSR